MPPEPVPADPGGTTIPPGRTGIRCRRRTARPGWITWWHPMTRPSRKRTNTRTSSRGRPASFGPGMVLALTPGSAGLAVAADAAAGDDDSFAGVSDAELLGVLCAWEPVEAHAAARKLAAVAELYRRRPEPGCEPQGPARMPMVCE